MEMLQIHKEGALHGAKPSGRKLNGGRLVVSALPWMIIAFLLWAGLFIKPQPVGATVKPPVMESRDHYYGLAWVADRGMFLAGSNGKLVRIDLSGQVERIDVPTQQTLQDVAFWNGRQGVAVGNEGVVLRTSDAGVTWQEVPNVPKSAVANKLTRVRLGGEGEAVACGEMGGLLGSHDGGLTWKRLRPEEDQAWNDVAPLPGGQLVAVGEFGRIAKSTDGGNSWSDAKVPVATSLMSLAFSDPLNGLAVGLDGTAVMTSDGGKTWSIFDLGVHEHLFDVAWDATARRWLATGSLGLWVSIAAGKPVERGRLDERDLSWHTRVLPTEQGGWFAGANVGRWDGKTWSALGHGWQPTTLINLPGGAEKAK